VLLKGLKFVCLGAAGALFATSLYAESHDHGSHPKVGLEYRAGISHDDGKLQETTGVDASSSTMISTDVVKLTAEGEAAEHVSYMFSYDALNSAVHLANARLQLHDMLGLTIGRVKANQGGWHVKDFYGEYNAVEGNNAFGYGSQAMPFSTWSDSISLHVALAGELTVQLVDDVMCDGSSATCVYKNTTNKGPAATIEWMGNFAGWMPLVQLASYDLNNSMAYSVGVKGGVAGLGLMLNYTADNRKNNLTDETDAHSQIDVHVDYSLGSWQPWLAYHAYDNKQGGTDVKANGAMTDMSDNISAITLGVKCNAVGEGYVPYLALVQSSGTWFKDGTGAVDSTETRSGMAIKAGVTGQF